MTAPPAPAGAAPACGPPGPEARPPTPPLAMPRLLAVLALLVVAPACDTAGEEPSFRVDVTGAVEATLTGRPRVNVVADRAGPLYSFVLGSGFSVVTLGGIEPRVGTYGLDGSLVVLVGVGGGVYSATGGEATVESVEGRRVRARFALDAGGDGGAGRVRLEGTFLADLDDQVPGLPAP